MKFNFFHPAPNYQLSKFKFWQGVFIGIGSAFSFYGLLFIIRESIRLSTSIGNNFSVWIISEQDVQSWNFIFATIAVIFGQSLAIKYMFSGSKSFRGQRRLLSIRVVTDATVLTNYFLYWLSMLLFSFFFYYALGKGYFEEPDMEYHWFVWGLIFIVLVLEQWKSLRLFHNNLHLKHMLISILILFALAFTLSQINIIDYKKINTLLNSNKPVKKYKIQLPVVKNHNQYNEWTKVWLTCPLIENVDSIGTQKILFDNHTLEIDSLSNYIENHNYRYLYIKMNFDKRNKTGVYKELLEILAKGKNHKIYLSIIPEKYITDPSQLTRGDFVNYRNISRQLLSISKEETNLKFFNSSLAIQILPDKQVLIENQKTDMKDIAVVLKQLLPENDHQSIVINVDDDCIFEDFMVVYDSILSFKKKRIDNISIQNFTNSYNRLYRFDDLIKVNKLGLSIIPVSDSVFNHYYPQYR